MKKQIRVMGETDTHVLAALETFLNTFEEEPVETALEALREKIKEMKTGKAPYEVVGSTK